MKLTADNEESFQGGDTLKDTHDKKNNFLKNKKIKK